MRFSEHFGINRDEADDWYDPILFEDTLFFVDPFLIYQSNEKTWADSHEKLTQHFNEAIKLVALSGFNSGTMAWKKAKKLLTFPEPDEVCLGYAFGSADGGGTGPKNADAMIHNIVISIQRGLSGVENFEELALFGENIGADRISDAVLNILKSNFIEYTQSICKKHAIKMSPFVVRNGTADLVNYRWLEKRVELPENPYRNRPVILVPEKFLRDLPGPFIDHRDFWAYAWSNFNADLRTDFNFALSKDVDMREIIRLARERPAVVNSYVEKKIRSPEPAYDLGADREVLDKWWEIGKELSEKLTTKAPVNQDDLDKFIDSLVNEYKESIENQGSWALLRNDDGTPRKERVAQSLFRSTLIHYCKSNNIDISGESNAGRGSVDFKFSKGWEARVLVEIKRANNAKFWHGLETQLPQYLTSEQVSSGIYVVIMQRDEDFEQKRDDEIARVVRQVNDKLKANIRIVIIDSRQKLPASKK